MLKAARKRERLDIASANLWLAQGAPIADVLTMLEVRHRFEFSSADCKLLASPSYIGQSCRHRFEFSSADCKAYATEILWAAQQQIHTTKPNLKPHRKEPHHAAA